MFKSAIKVNLVKEACAKYFAVHILEIRNLANNMKKQNKKHQNAKFIGEKLKSSLFHFFDVTCKIAHWAELQIKKNVQKRQYST